MEGKSLDSRDGGLKQDKQERRRKLWKGKLEGDLSFTLSNFSRIVNEDKYTGYPTQNKKLPPRKNSWNVCRTAVYAS